MERAVIVRGRLRGTRQIDLDEPLEEVTGEVEVLVRALPGAAGPTADIDAVVRALPSGSRTRADIDRELVRARADWDDR
jgi:hypothetical protein